MGEVTARLVPILGKSVFQIHGVDTDGTVIRKRVGREVLEFFLISACLVGIEARPTAHGAEPKGSQSRLMPPS